MLGIGKLERRLRALDERVEALESQLRDVLAQNKALLLRLEVEQTQLNVMHSQCDEQSETLSSLVGTISRLERSATEHASVLVSQDAALENLLATSEELDFSQRQLKLDLVATQLQAERDLAEMRETSKAVAATVLLKSGNLLPTRGESSGLLR